MAAPTATTSSGLTPLWGFEKGLLAAVRQVLGQLLELGPGEGHLEVLGPVLVGRDEGQVDARLQPRGELDLGPLRRFSQPLQRLPVGLEVDAVFLLELLGHPVHDPAVVVVATKVGVAVGGLDLEDAVADVEDGDVEGAAAEVEDEDRLVLLLLQAVGQRGGGGLVDDPQDVETRDLAGVLGRLPLRVVEVGGDGDDRVRHLFAQVRLGVRLELLEDHRRDLLGRELLLRVGDVDDDAVVLPRFHLIGNDLSLALDFAELASHEALDRSDRVLRVDCGLAARQVADESLAGLGEGDDGRCGPGAFGVRDDDRLSALHHGDDGVRRPEVDAYGLSHAFSSRV
jgi:hypothetical protein